MQMKSGRGVVELLVQNGARITDRTVDGWTLLHDAVLREDESLTFLLRNGAGAMAQTPSKLGQTPVSMASANPALQRELLRAFVAEQLLALRTAAAVRRRRCAASRLPLELARYLALFLL